MRKTVYLNKESMRTYMNLCSCSQLIEIICQALASLASKSLCFPWLLWLSLVLIYCLVWTFDDCLSRAFSLQILQGKIPQVTILQSFLFLLVDALSNHLLGRIFLFLPVAPNSGNWSFLRAIFGQVGRCWAHCSDPCCCGNDGGCWVVVVLSLSHTRRSCVSRRAVCARPHLPRLCGPGEWWVYISR